LHDWEQSTAEEHIIKHLTIENQTILDQMMGTGTIGVASLRLHRKFIGIEKNSHTFEMAKVMYYELRSIIINGNQISY
jgi:DNA modification methylase